MCSWLWQLFDCDSAKWSRNALTPNAAWRTSSLLELVTRGRGSASSDPNQHPAITLISVEEVEATQTPIALQNTQKSTEWAVHLFKSWQAQKNEHSDTDKYPEDILLTDDHGLLCKWLCISASEARKVDGSQCTPRSIAQLFAGLQRYINKKNSADVQLVDPKNPVFKPLHQLHDRLYRDPHA